MDVMATLGAALAAPRHAERLLRLHTPLGPDVLVAETLDGRESLDEGGFRLELTALSTDAHLDLDSLPGQPVLLEWLTASATLPQRPFHGHVTAAERLGSNGGLARYRLVVEPWLAFLRQRVDCYVFQDMDVVDIVESVLSDYLAQGALAPAWRWDLRDRSVYRKRSLCTQYDESDLDFLHRLLAEEGIHYRFEHHGDSRSPALGAHTLVLADHNDAFADLGTVRFHRGDASEREDAVQQWSTQRRWRPQRLQRASWDYRTLQMRPVQAGSPDAACDIVDDDALGIYAYPDRETGDRLARHQLEAQQVVAATVRGSGGWRQLHAGARFSLIGHPTGGDHVCLRLRHRARNNFDARVVERIERQLGRVQESRWSLPSAFDGDGQAIAADPFDDGADFYRNQFDCIPADSIYRPRTHDGHGLRLHPRPTVHGTQTAIVVSDGAPLLTDRDHRIQVQFHWQRGADASQRLPHPGGEDNAPGCAGAWMWVRVATAWAGDNWGSVLVPRRGQEVLVAFLEGDIDRPVVIGSLYNGQGQQDAAHNRIATGTAGATGNAPAWFDGHDHRAVFTGFKTQQLGSSQDGNGGYQLLRLDDTPGQGRVEAATTQHASRLVLGHLKAGSDNVRGADRGFGIELATQAGGALRAGAGLLLSTDGGTQQLTATGAQQQLAQTRDLLQSLQQAARTQRVTLPEEPETLPALASLETLQQTLQADQQGTDAQHGIGGGQGQAPGWSQPALLFHSPDGIVSLTASDQVWVSGTQTTLAAGRHLQWMSQGANVIAAAGGIALHTLGTQPSAQDPVQRHGIALHAAQGHASLRAHRNQASIAAKHSITLASTQADIAVEADRHVLLTAKGAYLKLEGDNIELGAPGRIEFKATRKEWTGPRAATGSPPSFGEADPKFCELDAKRADAYGGALVAIG